MHATKLVLPILSLLSWTAMAACYQAELKSEHVSGRFKHPTVVLSWSGQLKDLGHIAVGDESKNLADFACMPNDNYSPEPTSNDSFLCKMGDAGSFRLQLDHRVIKSILLRGKFGLQKVDDSGGGDLVVKPSQVNNTIAVSPAPASVCEDIFPPEERHAQAKPALAPKGDASSAVRD